MCPIVEKDTSAFTPKSKQKRAAIALAVALAALCISPASAESRVILGIAIENGGDELIEAELTDGSKADIKAGGLAHLEIGVRSDVTAALHPSLDTDLTLGYKVDSSSARNGDLSFSRFTLNLMPFFRATEKIRIGLGLTYHLNPTFEADVPSVSSIGRFTADADNALGFMLAADYAVTDALLIGLRATQIDYDFSSGGGSDSVDGDSYGLYATLRFGA